VKSNVFYEGKRVSAKLFFTLKPSPLNGEPYLLQDGTVHDPTSREFIGLQESLKQYIRDQFPGYEVDRVEIALKANLKRP